MGNLKGRVDKLEANTPKEILVIVIQDSDLTPEEIAVLDAEQARLIQEGKKAGRVVVSVRTKEKAWELGAPRREESPEPQDRLVIIV